MRTRAILTCLGLLSAAGGACGGGDDGGPADASPPVQPAMDLTRDIVSTHLAFDVTAHTGTAVIQLAPSADSAAASFEIGDLDIHAVTSGGAPLLFTDAGDRLDIGVPISAAPTDLTITYDYHLHQMQDGVDGGGYTLLWPYFCGNLFPCHSAPADGTTFTLDLQNIPIGLAAVYPTSIPSDAPSYQVAWSIAAYDRLDLGTTTHGTHLSAWYLPNRKTATTNGTKHLKDAFQWYEDTIGPYRFGTEVGSVAVNWGGGAFGGMEHHPFWHISDDSIGDEETHAHEAAHGWFGDGIRMACWEDFVLSEGTVTYLAGRALEVVAPGVGAAVWNGYAAELNALTGTEPTWPQGCNELDILDDGLFSEAPYMRGAFFYRAVALKIGAEQLDIALHDFYAAHAGQPARMADMISQIQTTTGYDATACADSWLRSTTIPAIGPCP